MSQFSPPLPRRAVFFDLLFQLTDAGFNQDRAVSKNNGRYDPLAVIDLLHEGAAGLVLINIAPIVINIVPFEILADSGRIRAPACAVNLDNLFCHRVTPDYIL
jgi:hypothetical protein